MRQYINFEKNKGFAFHLALNYRGLVFELNDH